MGNKIKEKKQKGRKDRWKGAKKEGDGKKM